MKRLLFKRNFIFISILIFILIFSTACSNETEDVTRVFENTTWRSRPMAMELNFGYNNSANISEFITPNTSLGDLNLDNFEGYKDIIGFYENITIEKVGKRLRIYNTDKLDLEFKIISENEIEDEYGNLFRKR